MEVNLKQRIIGAIVLAALAIIFLPLLFKGSTNTTTETKQVSISAPIPPAAIKPATGAQPIVMIQNKDLNMPVIQSPVKTQTVAINNPINKPAPAINNTGSNNLDSIEDKALNPPGVNQVTEPAKKNIKAATAKPATHTKKPLASDKILPKKSVNESITKTTITKKQAETSHHNKTGATTIAKTNTTAVPAKTPAGAAWTVRLGSFANVANVKTLVGQLHAKGFKAYTQPVKTPSGTLIRVSIGPEVKLEKANIIKQRLAKEMNIKSQVVPFSPS